MNRILIRGFGIVLLCGAILGYSQKSLPVSKPMPVTLGQPDHKKILSILFENMDASLSQHSSCNGVGTSTQDSTIGQYLSGFWAYHVNNDGGNSLHVESVPKKKKNNTVEIWEVRVLIRRYQGEEIWSWGVSFEITGQDHRFIPKSFKCLGAG